VTVIFKAILTNQSCKTNNSNNCNENILYTCCNSWKCLLQVKTFIWENSAKKSLASQTNSAHKHLQLGSQITEPISNWKYFLKNRAVEAAKSNRLSLRHVNIHLGRICSKRCRSKNWVFLHTLFLKNEAQINKNNYATMLFMSKQVSLPKISLILQKKKNRPKMLHTPFLHKSLQL